MAEIVSLADKRRGYPVRTKLVEGKMIEIVEVDKLTEEQFKRFCEHTGSEYFHRLNVNL